MALNSTGGGWSTGDSHDSGIGSSPPFEGIRGGSGVGPFGGNNIISNGVGGAPLGIKIQMKWEYYDIMHIYLHIDNVYLNYHVLPIFAFRYRFKVR